MNILFVCTGNTCRSPMAEGYLRSKNIKIKDIFFFMILSPSLSATTTAQSAVYFFSDYDSEDEKRK